MKLSVFYDHILQAAVQTGKSLEELLEGVKAAGIDAVEINMSYLCEHQEAYRLLQQAGLQVSCVYEFYEMEHRDEGEKAKRHLDTAGKAKAERILVVPGFFSQEEAHSFKECVADYNKTAAFLNKNEKALRMAEGLSFIAEKGADAGVYVTVEDFDDTGSPLSCVNGMRWFFERIPQLKGTFDTGNFIIQREDVLTAWELLKEKIVHIHCKDRGIQPLAVGDGYIPMREILERVQKIHYGGYLAIEHFDAADQETCMRKSAAFLKRTWNICSIQ